MRRKGLLFNSLIISLQKFFAAIVGIFITPIILQELGVKDYGIYTLMVGFVGALTFINWSLSMTTQRYVAFALGEKKIENQFKAFSNAMLIHLLYAVAIFFIIVIMGWWAIDSILEIPIDRVDAARVLLFLVGGITVVSLIATPYLGVIKAHENFILFSGLGVAETIFKILIVIVLKYFSFNLDKLIYYTILLLISAILVLVINWYYTTTKFKEAVFSIKYIEKKILKNMLGFMGWNIFSSFAVMGRNQGVSVILNVFFGVIINAAYGIASQVNFALGILSQGISGALTPRILKNAGSKDEDLMVSNMILMTKLSVISSAYFILIFLLEAQFILNLWLKIIPDNTVIFTQYILLFSFTTSLSGGFQVVFNAIGKVKEYSIWVSTIILLNLPIGYLLFKFGYPPQTIFLVAIVLELFSLFARVYLLKKYVTFNVLNFFFQIFIKTLMPIVFVIISALLIPFELLEVQLIRALITFTYIVLIYSFLVYFISLDKKEQSSVINIFVKK